MAKNYKKIIILGFLVVVLIAILAYPKVQTRLKIRHLEKENAETMEVIKQALPENKLLEVPFICQAPLQTVKNWESHEESCEEAALLQAYLYETNSTMTKEEANQEILKMIDWEKQNLGSHHDLYADDMKQFIMGYYGLTTDQVKIIYDASIEDIKEELNAGHPVIVPVTAKLIDNPYYPYPGYHMLTVIGYTADKIITNDNGTRHGASFSYDTDTFKTAMDDAGGDVVVVEMK
jgi:hypothetical protein